MLVLVVVLAVEGSGLVAGELCWISSVCPMRSMYSVCSRDQLEASRVEKTLVLAIFGRSIVLCW